MSTLVGKQAPTFHAGAVVNGHIIDKFSLEAYRGNYVVFFFYPLDFTFVCPTELHAFQEKLEEFAARSTQVVGCSVDSVYSHFAWLQQSKTKGGIEGITYPIVSDINKTIARDYGVLLEEKGVALRGLFLIDKKGVVRHVVVNDLPLGRSVDEALRMVDALTYFEENGEVCPANWTKGAQSMTPDNQGLEKYFSAKEKLATTAR
ncbi:peroxiredoxin [Simkania negevensis]|uniref:Thioredoxin peroxidase n=1 Tax=Simkania negevensis TaxID=83561 RepID=A0ABS3AR23_9BACT|nr:peroxiredoxin [Simkania negevensis]